MLRHVDHPTLEFSRTINAHQVLYMHNCTDSREVKNPACSLDFYFFSNVFYGKNADFKVREPKIIFRASFFLPE